MVVVHRGVPRGSSDLSIAVNLAVMSSAVHGSARYQRGLQHRSANGNVVVLDSNIPRPVDIGFGYGVNMDAVAYFALPSVVHIATVGLGCCDQNSHRDVPDTAANTHPVVHLGLLCRSPNGMVDRYDSCNRSMGVDIAQDRKTGKVVFPDGHTVAHVVVGIAAAVD